MCDEEGAQGEDEDAEGARMEDAGENDGDVTSPGLIEPIKLVVAKLGPAEAMLDPIGSFKSEDREDGGRDDGEDEDDDNLDIDSDSLGKINPLVMVM